MNKSVCLSLLAAAMLLGGCASEEKKEEREALKACRELVKSGFRPIADERDDRFLGKVAEYTAKCRGGYKALEYRDTPWMDWPNYWATGDASSQGSGIVLDKGHLSPNGRGIDGALLDLEYQRIELIKFNLFDNYTWQAYVEGRDGDGGSALKIWDEMRLPAEHPDFEEVGGDGEQLCQGDLIRHRTVTGICNDIRNPMMGSTNTVFARNSQFETTFPDLGWNELVRNRHGDRLSLLEPDPQLISRKLFTRLQTKGNNCNQGRGDGRSPEANCDYQKAPFFNVLAAFWIQFMNHDWFSHLDEGRNSEEYMKLGCDSAEAQELGCRPGDSMERALVHQDDEPGSFTHDGKEYTKRAPKTFRNAATAWWDASQIYGYDDGSRARVKRDPDDPARLLMVQRGDHSGVGQELGYLPLLQETDPMHPIWAGQEATGFPDNFTIGMSFYHNVFAREHNQFVDAFRAQQAATPEADSGLRDPADPERVITYADITDDELFETARLVISALIAKIHTIEWTTQLLYNEPLYRGMNSNWGGLLEEGKHDLVERVLAKIVVDNYGQSDDPKEASQWYSVFASGPGIFGLGSKRYEGKTPWESMFQGGEDIWDIANPDHVNGGINHFGSPFNFPEEFITVYRLHPLVPDLLEFRDWEADPNVIQANIPVVETFRGPATQAMTEGGLANWALSMGRQRLGLLTLQNHAQFLQNLPMGRLTSETQKIDVAALDVIRDRERGIPRFNEFRRQYGLRQLTSFDDFVDQRLPESSAEWQRQRTLVATIREIYGQHECDETKVITFAQLNDDGSPINDCLGHPDGSMVDNIEDLDTVVGWLAEFTRPHGYAISETQFVVFILNASRRLFSDRFFTSSFRPEFYTRLGHDWVVNSGPDGPVMEKGKSNGHEQLMSPLKRVLLRTTPELASELEHVINVFDPWARDRGEYYSLEWKARPGAESDPAFAGL